MLIRQSGNSAINTANWSRGTFDFTSTALPSPCTAKTFLARSIPIVIMLLDFPLRGFKWTTPMSSF